MTSQNSQNHEHAIRAARREQKKRTKMAVHGRGIKSLPSRGVPRIKARRVR